MQTQEELLRTPASSPNLQIWGEKLKALFNKHSSQVSRSTWRAGLCLHRGGSIIVLATAIISARFRGICGIKARFRQGFDPRHRIGSDASLIIPNYCVQLYLCLGIRGRDKRSHHFAVSFNLLCCVIQLSLGYDLQNFALPLWNLLENGSTIINIKLNKSVWCALFYHTRIYIMHALCIVARSFSFPFIAFPRGGLEGVELKLWCVLLCSRPNSGLCCYPTCMLRKMVYSLHVYSFFAVPTQVRRSRRKLRLRIWNARTFSDLLGQCYQIIK